jgi:glycosyltransferase involved in cell wall biosynthesis
MAVSGITVLIPAYRAQATIDRALASVQSQTLLPDRIVIVDDGSPEPLVVEPGQAAPIPIALLQLSENLGSSAALNHGLKHVDTKWTAFLDADDSWHPEKLSRQMDMARARPESMLIATGLRFVSSTGIGQIDVATKPLPEEPTQRLASLIEDCVIGKPSVLVRTEVVKALGSFNTKLIVGEDQDLWLRVAAAHRVDIVPDILTFAHDTPGSLTKRRDLPPDYLWRNVIALAIEQHRHRFSHKQLRRMIGARCQQAAVAHLSQGNYLPALTYLWRSTVNAYQPLQNLVYALAPLKHGLKPRTGR